MALCYYQDENAWTKINAFLFKFVFSLRSKETISPTIEATNSILVSVVKWRHHANSLLAHLQATFSEYDIIFKILLQDVL